MELEEAKAKYIQAWGALGTSWGINKAMAMIHALLMVSIKPLSTEDVMEELKISRGNANMNIRALINWGIVEKKIIPGERKEYFVAEKDIMEVARQVTKERQKREIEPILKVLIDIKNVKGESPEAKAFKTATEDIYQFTNKVNTLLSKFSTSDENWFMKMVLKILK
ncbi:MAG: transcriptional regulator [Saprospiraceae bacterium]